ncbi:hypothetical protein C453_12696 [Haloferax elongans ATCC BAA-1513]|uniref:Uncharacterized protein n=1 Tax=Haloferax elongans ATCC BAA-1513 TaxID=1230453 RepID=M0HMS6_HALEO|nr:hypothetical protein [Haloferax elongans]ELZ84404.1 hypothetical protein C453_12696 [Haloferax elongans ATCC BAA-1513]
MRLQKARALAGLIFAAAFAVALLADVLFPTTAQLTGNHITVFASVLSALFGVEIARARWGQLAAAASGALSGWHAADQEDSDD